MMSQTASVHVAFKLQSPAGRGDQQPNENQLCEEKSLRAKGILSRDPTEGLTCQAKGCHFLECLGFINHKGTHHCLILVVQADACGATGS